MRTICAAVGLVLTLVPAAFAQDSAAAGPDFWAVDGLQDGHFVNVRARPDLAAPVLAHLTKGTILRNLGCQGEADRRWCEVAAADGRTIKGWVAGRFLVESGPPQGDALVPGTPYNATGSLPCQLRRFPDTTTCDFGVIRAPTGLASIFITLPGGQDRLIEFRDGAAVEPLGTTMTTTKVEDMITVTLDGGAEIFTVADVVYLGD